MVIFSCSFVIACQQMVAFFSGAAVIVVKPPNYHMNRKEMDFAAAADADRSVLIGTQWGCGQWRLASSCLQSGRPCCSYCPLTREWWPGKWSDFRSVVKCQMSLASVCLRQRQMKHIRWYHFCASSTLLFLCAACLSFNRCQSCLAVTVPGIVAKLPVATLPVQGLLWRSHRQRHIHYRSLWSLSDAQLYRIDC